MKKNLIIGILSASFMLTACMQSEAFASESSDVEPATCYTFSKSNKLLSKGDCKVALVYGAGGSETTISFKGKKYFFSEPEILDEEGNVIEAETGYMRDSRNLKIAKTEEEIAQLPFEKTVFCKVSKSLDVCYFPKH